MHSLFTDPGCPNYRRLHGRLFLRPQGLNRILSIPLHLISNNSKIFLIWIGDVVDRRNLPAGEQMRCWSPMRYMLGQWEYPAQMYPDPANQPNIQSKRFSIQQIFMADDA